MAHDNPLSDDRILLAHGGGGVLTWELIERLIRPSVGPGDPGGNDASVVPGFGDLMMTTDSFVVKPLFFRGGDIGSLSVHGTVNDLAVSGAEPLALSLGLIIEEGLETATLQRVLESLGEAARACDVEVITGDTKVVPRGQADKLYINTAGVGRRVASPSPGRIAPGDALIISGGIAEHGVAVMSEREGLSFGTPVASDSASVWPMVRALLDAGLDVHAMRDPTRGGVASTCVEMAEQAGVTFLLDEAAIPVAPQVQAACDMLGLDPLNVANEGKLLVFVPGDAAGHAVEVLREVEQGKGAVVIGNVVPRREKAVFLQTRFGGSRIVEMSYGEDLPRIC